jgi:DNA-binding winged helix-turn-helix (wHTH) protein
MMAAAIRSTISSFGRLGRAPNSNSTQFLDGELGPVPVSGIPEELCKLSSFLPVIVLIPKSAVRGRYTHKESCPNASIACLADSEGVTSLLGAAKTWFTDPSTSDTFEFGGVTACFSTMEVHRNGRPVVLTCKEFKTLAYFIKNPRRVISRDELLNEVWGYENYPCTRTVDNHILRLRQKLETEPAHPKHFQTVHGAGYRFLP